MYSCIVVICFVVYTDRTNNCTPNRTAIHNRPIFIQCVVTRSAVHCIMIRTNRSTSDFDWGFSGTSRSMLCGIRRCRYPTSMKTSRYPKYINSCLTRRRLPDSLRYCYRTHRTLFVIASRPVRTSPTYVVHRRT